MKKISLVLAALSVIMMLVFAGCSGEKVEGKIIVDGTETVFTAKSKDTVGEVLEENGITLGAEDEIDISVETELGTETKEINIFRMKTIKVKADSKETEVKLTKGTAADALEKAGLKLGKNDKLSCDENSELTDGMEIEIIRGVAVKVTVKGEKKEYVTTKKTVEAALKELGIKVDEDDIVEPSKDTKIKKGMEITVKAVEVKTETEEKVIYYTEKKEYSSSMNKGTSKVKQNGVNGKKEVTSENTYIDGELTESKVIEEKVITQPVNKIVVYGTKTVTTTSGKSVVSKERVEDCDGSGHGYYVITWSDGSVTYEEF
ncbi:MAG: DUF348 domain-containing protein [Clostridia bacterium]|nr:DUF348 domain-containing protein [Clostridia bacterium]